MLCVKIIELIDEDFAAEVVDLPELVYDDVEMYGMVSGHHKNHHNQNVESPERPNHTSRSLIRRVFSFLKQTWTGVKFSLGTYRRAVAEHRNYKAMGSFVKKIHEYDA